MVNCYHSVMDSLSETKSIILAQRIIAVRKELYYGSQRVNWNSLSMLLTESEMSVEINIVHKIDIICFWF